MNKNKEIFKIPKEGSLGLLAYGDIGLRAWRKAREVAINNNKKNKKSDTNE